MPSLVVDCTLKTPIVSPARFDRHTQVGECLAPDPLGPDLPAALIDVLVDQERLSGLYDPARQSLSRLKGRKLLPNLVGKVNEI